MTDNAYVYYLYHRILATQPTILCGEEGSQSGHNNPACGADLRPTNYNIGPGFLIGPFRRYAAAEQ